MERFLRGTVAAIGAVLLLVALVLAGFAGLVLVEDLPVSGAIYLGALLSALALGAVALLARASHTGSGGSSW